MSNFPRFAMVLGALTASLAVTAPASAERVPLASKCLPLAQSPAPKLSSLRATTVVRVSPRGVPKGLASIAMRTATNSPEGQAVAVTLTVTEQGRRAVGSFVFPDTSCEVLSSPLAEGVSRGGQPLALKPNTFYVVTATTDFDAEPPTDPLGRLLEGWRALVAPRTVFWTVKR